MSIFIYIHAAFGGIALIAGLIALIAKKGLKLHRVSGSIFFWSMLTSSILALVISCLPNHENVFLFAVGVFSTYLICGGKLAIRHKLPEVNFTLDQILASLMILTGLGMIIYPIVLTSKINIILTVFGSLGIALSIQDLIAFKKPEKLRNSYLRAHVGKMVGGYIAATTAFLVVNQVLPSLIGWLGPTVIGTPIIFYYNWKFLKK